MTVQHLARVAAIAFAGFLVAGCDLIAPQLGPTSLTVTARAAPDAGMSIGGTTVEATIEAFGLQVLAWQVDGSSRAVPPGDYTLEVWTVHHSDDIGCEVDPAVSGESRCNRDSTVVARCSLEIRVPAGSDAWYRYVREARDQCTLVAA